MHQNLITRRGDDVIAGRTTREITDDDAPGLLEIKNGIAHFLQLSHTVAAAVNADKHARDIFVPLRDAQRSFQRTHGQFEKLAPTRNSSRLRRARELEITDTRLRAVRIKTVICPHSPIPDVDTETDIKTPVAVQRAAEHQFSDGTQLQRVLKVNAFNAPRFLHIKRECCPPRARTQRDTYVISASQLLA